MRIAAGLLIAMVCGCSNTPVHIESRALPRQSNPTSERLIVAAVNNGGATFMQRAGSTPRGYDTLSAYGATPRALDEMRAVESDYGLREVNAWPIEPLHLHCAVLEAPQGADRATLLSLLSHDSRVRLAQPLQTFATHTEAYNDPYLGLQRGFHDMNVAGAHPWSRGEGVRVAIIDTGADIEHKDLRDNIVQAANFVDADDAQFLRDRHGTEMAGVIAAVANNREGIVGIAPDARILVFKACWQLEADADSARCNSFTLARALVAAFDARAQVINLSLAGPEDPLLRGLIQEGRRRGIVIVGAAADTPDATLFHETGVIEVASAEAAPPGDAALQAPGREILTLLPGGRYDFATGASIATAEVTGVVSLLLARDRHLSSAAAYALLHDSSVHSAAGDDGAAAGRPSIDACAAVIALLRRGSCKRTQDIEPALAGAPEHRVAVN